MQKALKRARKGSYNKSRYKQLKGSRKSILRIPVKLLKKDLEIVVSTPCLLLLKGPRKIILKIHIEISVPKVTLESLKVAYNNTLKSTLKDIDKPYL